MIPADPGLDRLAALVESRRLALGLSIEAAAGRVGMSPTTWTRVERGETVRKLTWAGVDRALGWEPGSCVRAVEGAEPITLPAASADEVAPSRYVGDPVLRHLWETPDPDLTDGQREALVQMYRALKRTADRPQATASEVAEVRQLAT